MSLIVKICGLSTEETLDAALDAGADMVGFVFYANSPRNIRPEAAAALADKARGKAEIVALLADAPDEHIDEIVRVVRPTWLQLHRDETPERVVELRKRHRLKIMKAIGVAAAADFFRIRMYAEVADRLLLDAKPPRAGGRPGGHGRAFDWTILKELDHGTRYLLAGGLTPGNVGDAIRTANPLGVDVSSGVETAPGRKDPDLIRAFIAAARRAEARVDPVSA